MARMDNNRLSDFKQAPAYLRKKILIIKSKQRHYRNHYGLQINHLTSRLMNDLLDTHDQFGWPEQQRTDPDINNPAAIKA